MSIKKAEKHGKYKRVGSGRVPCVKLPKSHPCKGCVWYVRDTDVLFCPFSNCIRKK